MEFLDIGFEMITVENALPCLVLFWSQARKAAGQSMILGDLGCVLLGVYLSLKAPWWGHDEELVVEVPTLQKAAFKDDCSSDDDSVDFAQAAQR